MLLNMVVGCDGGVGPSHHDGENYDGLMVYSSFVVAPTIVDGCGP